MSTPFWVSGSAAMKMMRSTSSTSMSGVTFMSALACGTSAADDLFGAEMLVGVLHYCAPPAVCPGTFFFSVISAMFSICALRSASMASMIAAYLASLSPLR